MSSEISEKYIFLKHDSASLNYVQIKINKACVIFFFFFFAITNLKNFSWCNVIQQIKETLA